MRKLLYNNAVCYFMLLLHVYVICYLESGQIDEQHIVSLTKTLKVIPNQWTPCNSKKTLLWNVE